MKIAVDVMTAEKGLEVAINGAYKASTKGCEVILIGDEDKIKKITKRYVWPNECEIQHASQVVEMNEHPYKGPLRKKDSSIIVAANLVKEGRANALVSAGNSGATYITTTRIIDLNKVNCMEKYPIIITIKTSNGYSTIGDVGANADVESVDLVKFALAQQVYLKNVRLIDDPKIALLNIGIEVNKGRKIYKEADSILRKCDINYVGNLEPMDVFNGNVNGFVCCGDDGNYFIKTGHATGKFITNEVKKMLKNPLMIPLTIPAAPLLFFMYNRLKKITDKSNYASFILGLENPVVITHGNSNEKGIETAILTAQRAMSYNIGNKIKEILVKHKNLYK